MDDMVSLPQTVLKPTNKSTVYGEYYVTYLELESAQ